MLQLKIKKLTETAKIPTKGSKEAAGYDIYADTDKPVIIMPGRSYKFPTGIAMTPPEGYFGAIFARSGLSINKGLRPSNCVGVIDYDYNSEIIVALYNDSSESVIIQAHERIAQLVLLPYLNVNIQEVDKLEETVRGGGRFGSTGSL